MMDEIRRYNFGALQMPPGYFVAWFDCHEHYQAIGPGESGVWPEDYWESSISVNPHWCRRQAIGHAKRCSLPQGEA